MEWNETAYLHTKVKHSYKCYHKIVLFCLRRLGCFASNPSCTSTSSGHLFQGTQILAFPLVDHRINVLKYMEYFDSRINFLHKKRAYKNRSKGNIPKMDQLELVPAEQV